MPGTLDKELRFFERNRESWMEHYQGKYAIIKAEEIAGFYDSAESAYGEGVNRWGNTPFLVKQVRGEDPVERTPALAFGLLHADF